MFGKMDPKKMQGMMKKLNMKVDEIPAEEVIIKCKGRTITISNPEVMLVDMMGKDVYQVTGTVSESGQLSDSDIQMVMEQTGKDRETVVSKLEELNNDLAKAIMELKEKESK